ncbi:MAG TPA: protein translocase subunit SecD [Tepidisphaeraceae bacterium]|jgi:SecD/SecF fusion protein
MPTNIIGRLTLIFSVLIIALLAVFWPPANLFRNVPFSQKLNLKPGIDMVGGTSLTYEIKPPPGGIPVGTTDLAVSVMESLKKRVDPDGVRNLIWRPQGSRQIEIQMPSSGKAGESRKLRENYAVAQRRLEDTNVRAGEVIRAVEKAKGADRDNRLKQLAMGSATRQQLFAQLTTTYDQIQAAAASNNVPLQGEKELAYEKLKSQIEEINLSATQLESALGTAQPARDQKINELKARFADFPARVAAIDEFSRALVAFNDVKGTLDDAADLKRLLRGSGVLEFHILVPIDTPSPEVKAMIDRLQKHGPAVQAGDTLRWVQLDKPDELHGQSIAYNDKQWALIDITPGKSMTKQMTPPWALVDAHPFSDPTSGERKVSFAFDPQGGQYFGNLSSSNIGKPLAIVLDERLISAPTLRSRITDRGEISGNFTAQDINYLVRTLNAGSLPAQLADEPISEKTIGPQLGADNLRRGLLSCVIGLAVVAVFLVGYYYLSGVVAFVAVLLNLVLILGSMAAINATFTLPGIAGIVLTIGAAVDANVLVFERLREEQQRGLSLRMAMRNAYDRAWSAIVDSNATTLATSLFLYWFGSEEVKGFGLTLLIGLIWSLFTSLFVTKTIFAILIDKFHITKLGSLPLTFPKWDQALKPNIDWMGRLVWIFAGTSAAIMLIGLSAFFLKANQRQIADIEFASGTAVQFELKQPMDLREVRDRIDQPQFAAALPSPSVVSIGTENKEYEIVTPNAESTKVKGAVLAALGPALKVEIPSTYAGRDLNVGAARESRQVVPVGDQEIVIDGWTPQSQGRHVGGAAIVLRDLNPPLSANEIKARIDRARTQTQVQGGSGNYKDFDVNTPVGATEPSKIAVILTSDPNLPFDKDEIKWQEELASPMWGLVREAIGREAQLQRVSNFDAQVAGAARDDAFMALGFSLLAIMAYIWFRFGNLKYGTATVVAMLHDTLLVLGFIGLSHWMASYTPWLARILLIEPFRINLTIVAAVLTVMSYSMIDTIVVFDRIRENRGKFGHVSKRIINDSINQTLSRTLLTGGTNIATVAFMYVLGGPGIHGFTFVLLTGILVGTYSSIAIAAPILLVGGKKSEAPVAKPAPVGQLQRA